MNNTKNYVGSTYVTAFAFSKTQTKITKKFWKKRIKMTDKLIIIIINYICSATILDF